MDRLSNIIAFITVAETKSFADAAKRLNLANSVVSKRISDLEDYLGIRLFQRTTRRVSLTDAGVHYFDHASRLIDELAEVEEHIRFQNENPVGEVRLSAPMTFANQYLGPALSSFLEKYPDVAVRLHISDHHLEFADDVTDVAIFIGKPKATSLMTRKLAKTRRVVVASPQYLEKHGRPETPEDLKRHNCLIYSNVGDAKSWPFLIKGREVLQPVQGRFISDSGTLLCEAAINHCGITMLPTFIAGKHIVAGDLEILLEAFEDEPMDIQAVFPHKRHMSARVRKLIDHLAQYFSNFSGN